jgi:hypothetical protein
VRQLHWDKNGMPDFVQQFGDAETFSQPLQ